MEELIPITMFMCVAAVLILRPISKKVGMLLEAMTRERLQQTAPGPIADQQLGRVTALLEQISKRQELLEERLDFTERLLSSSRPGIAPAASASVGVFDNVRLGQETVNGLPG